MDNRMGCRKERDNLYEVERNPRMEAQNLQGRRRKDAKLHSNLAEGWTWIFQVLPQETPKPQLGLMHLPLQKKANPRASPTWLWEVQGREEETPEETEREGPASNSGVMSGNLDRTRRGQTLFKRNQNSQENLAIKDGRGGRRGRAKGERDRMGRCGRRGLGRERGIGYLTENGQKRPQRYLIKSGRSVPTYLIDGQKRP